MHHQSLKLWMFEICASLDFLNGPLPTCLGFGGLALTTGAALNVLHDIA
jgi:hypothetical protein